MSTIYATTTLYRARCGSDFCRFAEEVIEQCKGHNVDQNSPHYLVFNNVLLRVHKDSIRDDLYDQYVNHQSRE